MGGITKIEYMNKLFHYILLEIAPTKHEAKGIYVTMILIPQQQWWNKVHIIKLK